MKFRYIYNDKVFEVLLIALGTSCCLGCSIGERKVRVLDVNSGNVREIRNVASGYTREIAESSPCREGGAFVTLQNRLRCEGVNDRSVIRVYDTNANLICSSSIPFPDGIYLSPRAFSAKSDKIVYWNSKYDAKARRWGSTYELCVATLVDHGRTAGIKRIQMPIGCDETIDWDQSFMWSSSNSVVANVECQHDKERSKKKIVVVDVTSGDYRFLPFVVRSPLPSVLSSFQGSLSGRFFAFVTPQEEVYVCDGQGRVCKVIGADQLREFGLREWLESEMADVSWDRMLTLCWDDNDILWIFNRNGRYVGIDVSANIVVKNGFIGMRGGEELMGIIQRRKAIIKQKRNVEIARSIWGDQFLIKDVETGKLVWEMPNFISKCAYIGDGVLILEDL